MTFFSLDLRFPGKEHLSQGVGYIIPMINYPSLALCFISGKNLHIFFFHQLIPAIFWLLNVRAISYGNFGSW